MQIPELFWQAEFGNLFKMATLNKLWILDLVIKEQKFESDATVYISWAHIADNFDAENS